MTSNNKIEKKDLRRLFFRSLSMESSFNFERMMNMAYAFSMKPIIKKLYKNKEDQSEAMERHLEFFNTTSAMSPFILGVTTALEEKNANDKDFDTNSINAVKAGLMGPLAGIGDSIFWGTLRIIATGIGISLAQQGNILGPILFLLLFNIPNLLTRYFGVMFGYKVGTNFIQRMLDSGLMDKVTFAVSILGMMVVGAMTASMVTIEIPIKFGQGESASSIQEALDSIMPGLLPLTLTLGLYFLLKKGIKVLPLLFGLIILGIFGKILGLF